MAKFAYDPNAPTPRFLTKAARSGWEESRREWHAEQDRQKEIEERQRELDADSAEGLNRRLRKEEAAANRFNAAAAAGIAMHERDRAEEEAAYRREAGKYFRAVKNERDPYQKSRLIVEFARRIGLIGRYENDVTDPTARARIDYLLKSREGHDLFGEDKR